MNVATILGLEGMWGLIIVLVAVALGMFLSAVFAWKAFYKKAKADEAFVRTGMGGAKVFSDSGGFIIPLIHEIKWISLETMRLEVARRQKDALITKDKFRVDVQVEFYIRVAPQEDKILTAARSLGEKSLSAESVKELVEAKLVGALRSVAATKTLIELHEDRDGFADDVQKALMNDLPQNGLSLESVSIVLLDQTDKSVLDPDNVFDAEGLKLITDATERARKEKNEIQRKAEVAIKQQDVTAVTEKLTLDKDQEYATATQYKDVETYRAEREAETQRFKFEQEEGVRMREIEKDRAVQEAEIMRDQQVQEAEIGKEQRVREADIAKETYLISKDREREETQINKELAIEVAKREKEIGIIQKEKERELEHAKELEAVAERERAHQAVITVEKTAEADRQKDVLLINQRASSEKDKIEKEVAAQADLSAAELQAQAIERLATAKLAEASAEAEGEQRLIEAKNVIDRDVLVKEGVVEVAGLMPEIIRETMKPAEKISDIRVLNIQGAGKGADGGGGATNKVVDAFLQAGAAMPMFKEMLRFANIDVDNMSVTEALQKAAKKIPAVKKLLDQLPKEVQVKETGADGGKKARKKDA
jgi:uncharacterized membrane protein YqiK